MQKKFKTIKLKTDEIEYLMRLVGGVTTTITEGYPMFELYNKLKKRFEEAALLDPDYNIANEE
jgi:hypothetical protein